jgi:predicted outer membrane repeat protein
MQAVGDRYVAPGHSFYQQVWANDTDRDWLTFAATNLPQGLSINQQTGTITGNVPVGVYTPNQQFQVTYSASDGNGGVGQQTATLTITGVPNVWTVNTTADTADVNPGDGVPLDVDGKVSLRAAIMQANIERITSVLPTYVNFDPTVFGNNTTITLLSKLPPTASDITIIGTGKNNLTIQGGSNDGIFFVPLISGMVTVVRDLTLKNGNNRKDLLGTATGRGGSVEVLGNVFLDSVVIRDGTANLAGAIYVNGRATLLNTEILNTSTVGIGNNEGLGGGIDVDSGRLTAVNSSIKDAVASVRGGGISIRAASFVFLFDTSLIHNISPHVAGGVYNSGAWFQMLGGIVERNEAGSNGGGILNEGTAMFKNTTFDSNKAVGRGGAIDAPNGFGMCELRNCVFIGNHQAALGPKVAKVVGNSFLAFDCVGLTLQEVYEYQNN